MLGMAGAMALSRAASSLLFGVAWSDSFTLAGATVLLLAVALAAGYIPARRATKGKLRTIKRTIVIATHSALVRIRPRRHVSVEGEEGVC